ncbi:MAG TPA: hypothetical protein VNJ06_11455 [Gemmatimonadales bacterium]|nr:hypothetical protein [Gemmatimonadales bacterium]
MKRANAGKFMLMVLCAVACAEPPTSQVPQRPATSEPQGSPTPLQARIAQSVADRAARGLPVPKLSSDFRSAQGSSLSELRGKKYGPGEGYAYTARTELRYSGPADAGLDRWPELTLTSEQSERLGVTSVALRERYIAQREARSPGFWQRYELGLEPRTYTISESRRVTYPASPSLPASPALAEVADVTSSRTASGDLVFGFSVNIPSIQEERTFGIEDVEDMTLSFEADWGIGLRLPVAGQLSSPEPMAEGSTYSATSTMEGRNYTGAQYAAVGLPAEDGNEAYFRWVTQGCVQFSGIIDSDKHCAGPNVYRHSDFVTPFGPGEDVPLPSVDLAILDYGVAGIDLVVNSSVGSDQITADWLVLGAASGSGSLSYSSPSSPAQLSSVRAIDGPGRALFSVDGLLYHFTRFSVSPRLRFWVDLEIPIPLAPDITWEDSWSISLGTYDLSDFIDHDFIDSHGASVGLHHNPEYTGATRLTMEVEVVNVAPTASLAVTGGENLNIQGVPTIVGRTGDIFAFAGSAHDPGRDGLTLSWDWSDGPPAPDESALYPITGPTGPNDATDRRAHAFESACLYDVTFKAVDDDAASGEDHVSILITQTGQRARQDGYWQQQLGRNGAQLSQDVVACYVAIVGRVSAVFSEARAAANADDAFTVLNLRQNSGSELEKLDREIMVAWLNFASGAVGYSQMVDTNGDGTADTPFNQVMQAAESVRLDPAAPAAALRFQTQLVHQVSVHM